MSSGKPSRIASSKVSRPALKPAHNERDGEKLAASSDVRKSTTTAKKSKVEKEVLELRKENATLRKELAEVRAVYDQLVHESTTENFSERRVNLLKSQVIQLERQLLLLTQAIAARSQLLQDLQTMLDSLLEKLERVSSPEIDCITDTAKTMKGRIAKCRQACSMESLAQPLMFLNGFVEPKRRAFSEDDEKPVTLIDVCTGSSEHINLKHVSRLESKLALLYHALLELQTSLLATPPSSLLQPIGAHQQDHVTNSCKLIGECCHDLLCLSLLVPAANWPPLRGGEVSLELKADTILRKLPVAIRQRREVKEVIEATSKSFGYHSHMAALKCKALEQELHFHKSVYQLQLNYVSSLFEAVRKGYETFEQSAQELITAPLKDILQCYDSLSQSASDESLRNFLQLFKQYSDQLRNAVECMATSGSADCQQGTPALSAFGEHFFQSLKELESECDLKRQQQLTAQLHTQIHS